MFDPPTLDQRQEFLQLVAQGVSIRTAAAKAEIPVSTAKNFAQQARRTAALHDVNVWMDRHTRREEYDLETAHAALDDGWNVIVALAATF